MDYFNQLVSQAKAWWETASWRLRLGVVATVISVATVVGVGVWSSRSPYVPLVNLVGREECAAHVDRWFDAGSPLRWARCCS